MFTGIVTETGEVASMRARGKDAVLRVRAGASGGAAVGDSISVNGVCLTVTDIEAGGMGFDVSAETLSCTTTGRLKAGDRVNIEPSLRADGRLGGHFVTGHVDAVGRIIGRTREGDAFRFEVEAPKEALRYLVEKGSVAVDGISLTVVDVREGSFTFVVIPHTSEATTIGSRGAGDEVNIEADIISKYVHRFLSKGGGPRTTLMDALIREGYAGGG